MTALFMPCCTLDCTLGKKKAPQINERLKKVPAQGLEPRTSTLEGWHSIQLSYTGQYAKM